MTCCQDLYQWCSLDFVEKLAFNGTACWVSPSAQDTFAISLTASDRVALLLTQLGKLGRMLQVFCMPVGNACLNTSD